MVGIGSRAILGLKGAVLHLVDLGHFLEDHLALLDKYAHGRNYCLVTRHIPAKNEGKFQDVTILSCTLKKEPTRRRTPFPQQAAILQHPEICAAVALPSPILLSNAVI
jgi:hypothetical protein